MAVQPIGGVSAASYATPIARAEESGGADGRGAPDSTIVISMVTRTNPDGSTVTTITYADGHTKIETTPAKYAATEGGEERVTAVDILA